MFESPARADRIIHAIVNTNTPTDDWWKNGVVTAVYGDYTILYYFNYTPSIR